MTAVTERSPRERRLAGPGAAVRPSPRLIALAASTLLVLATALMLRRVEPIVNWYYISAWYPTLLLLDAAVAARTGRYYLLSRPRFAASLLAWSAILWFVFELVNFRVQNWYYVFLPPERGLRWLGTTLSFMTVLPAIFLAEHWLEVRGALAVVRWPAFRVGSRLRLGIFLAGVAFVAVALVWPRFFFPLIWGALTLLLEPWNYGRDPGRSLLGDLAAGRPARLLRLLLGGLAIGFVWELYNIEARSKWIYTVPGFESFKLFEMPLAGFLGFPIFALDCFVVYQSLVLAGVAVPRENPRAVGRARLRRGRTFVAACAAVAFAVAALFGMDRWNTDSYRPRLDDLWVADGAARERLALTPYRDLFRLANASPGEVADATGAPPDDARRWIEAARLATLRGIGTANARLLRRAGIDSVAELAAADPESLAARLRGASARPRAATPAKVRVWVRAARRVTDAAGRP